MRYQKLLFGASVFSAAIALNNCRHQGNMLPEAPIFQLELCHNQECSGAQRKHQHADNYCGEREDHSLHLPPSLRRSGALGLTIRAEVGFVKMKRGQRRKIVVPL
jgi:hypothetical protein